MKRLIPLLLLVFACRSKPQSWWIEPEIPVLAVETEWRVVESPLRSAFERVIRTPQVERLFLLRSGGPQELVRYAHARYLILVASLESPGVLGDIVREITRDPSVRQEVLSGERAYFIRRDVWARDQLVVILTGRDAVQLGIQAERFGNSLFDLFNEDLKTRLLDEMFSRWENKKLAKELLRDYGWTLRLQRGYFVAQSLPLEGIVWFRRTHPERWIFVRWIEKADTTGKLTEAWVVSERNRIGRLYYGNDRVAPAYLFSFRGEFLGRPARITQGLWENEEKIAGGPFKNYTFYDPPSERLYMLDIACFAPERDKLPLLRRMDLIAHSFRTLYDGSSHP